MFYSPSKKLILTSLILFIVKIVGAQTVVQGRIYDARSKSILPYCTIYFEGKKIGTKSDNFGNFTLKSPKTEQHFYVSFLGYEIQKVNIIGSEFKTNVYLSEKSKKTKEVKIVGKRKLEKDTLALRIIRSVIANRPQNRPSSFKSLQYDRYSKFEVDVANIERVLGKNFVTKPLKYMLEYKSKTPDGIEYSPLLFRETASKMYVKGSKKKQIILGVKDTKLFNNESIYALIQYTFDDYSIYDNNIIIANKAFLSPVGSGAPIFYRYYVEDSFESEGRKNYNLSFAPVSKEDFGFTGKMTVEAESWAIKHVDITLDKRANINFINHFALSQSFHKIGGKWVQHKDDKDIALSTVREAKKFIKLRFRMSDITSNEVIDQEINDDFFFGDAVTYNTNYRNVTDTFWESKRTEKLSDFEDGIYKRSDTFKRTKQYRTLLYMIRVGTTGFCPIYDANWELGRVYKLLSWNEYEGARWRVGGRIIFDSFPRFNIETHLAYGTKDKAFKYGVGGLFNLPTYNNNFHQLKFLVAHDYQRLGETESLVEFDNIALSLFRPPDKALRDIILKDNVKVTWTKEWKRGEETSLGVDFTKFYQNSFFKFDEVQSDGSTISRNSLTSARILMSYRYAIKEPVFQNKFIRMRLKSIRPIFMLQSSVGLKNVLGSDYSFMKVRGTATQIMPFVFGQFRYNFTCGKIFGRVPYIDIENMGGNNGALMDPNRFFLMNEGEYAVDQFAQLWVHHKFQGFFFNKIPLFKKLGFREGVHFRAAVGNISDQNTNFFRPPGQLSGIEGVYAETGVQISNILKFFEVNGIWRLTQHDKKDIRKFGILVGANFEL